MGPAWLAGTQSTWIDGIGEENHAAGTGCSQDPAESGAVLEKAEELAQVTVHNDEQRSFRTGYILHDLVKAARRHVCRNRGVAREERVDRAGPVGDRDAESRA